MQRQELAGGSPTGQYPRLLPTRLTTSYQRLHTHRNVSRKARVWVLLRRALQRAQDWGPRGPNGNSCQSPWILFACHGGGGSLEEARATAATASWHPCDSYWTEDTSGSRLALQKKVFCELMSSNECIIKCVCNVFERGRILGSDLFLNLN